MAEQSNETNTKDVLVLTAGGATISFLFVYIKFTTKNSKYKSSNSDQGQPSLAKPPPGYQFSSTLTVFTMVRY